MARRRANELHRSCRRTGLRYGSTLALAVAGCVPWRHHDSAIPRQSAARDTLLSTDLHRVDTLVARGSGALPGAFFGSDVIYLRAGATTTSGRDRVSLLLASVTTAAPLSWQPIGGGLAGDALSGYTFGVAIYAAETRSPAIARYIAFWRRVRGGPWQIIAYAEVGAGSPIVTAQAAATATEFPPPVNAPVAKRAAAEIAAADSDFADDAAISGTPAAFANAIAHDGVVFGGTEIVVGPTAVKEFFDNQRGVSITWHPVYAAASTSGDLGFTVGESVTTSRARSGAAVQRFGKYLTVWRKEANGKWKFVVDGGNSRPSPVGQ